MLKAPHPLPKERLEKLSTHRLLQVLKVARRAEIGLYCSCCSLPSWEVRTVHRQAWESEAAFKKRYAKAESEWTQEKAQVEEYIANIKAVLATREHVKRAP